MPSQPMWYGGHSVNKLKTIFKNIGVWGKGIVSKILQGLEVATAIRYNFLREFSIISMCKFWNILKRIWKKNSKPFQELAFFFVSELFKLESSLWQMVININCEVICGITNTTFQDLPYITIQL